MPVKKRGTKKYIVFQVVIICCNIWTKMKPYVMCYYENEQILFLFAKYWALKLMTDELNSSSKILTIK